MMHVALLSMSMLFTSLPLGASQFVLHGKNGLMVASVDEQTEEYHYLPYNCVGSCNESMIVYSNSGTVSVKVPSSLKVSSLDEVLADVLSNPESEVELTTSEQLSVSDVLRLMSHNDELKEVFEGMSGDVVIVGEFLRDERALEVKVSSKERDYTTLLPLD